MRSRIEAFALAGLLALSAGPADASRVHLFLQIDGSALECFSSVETLDRKNSIEAFALEGHLALTSTGQTQLRPILFTKRIDRCTPLIAAALNQRKTVRGVINFYGPDPQGNELEINYFRIEIDNARVITQVLISPEWHPKSITEEPSVPQLERVSLRYTKIIWTDLKSGNTHEASTPKGTSRKR